VVDVAAVSEAVAGVLAAELAAALAWYARRDQTFAHQLAAWAAQVGTSGVTQQVRAGRDAYIAGRDQTVTNYRHPGELDR